ncbi:MAG: hypothetical protein QUS09_04705 [Methanotrichaceae archaeon]|nr:hypothetical protein [Methanotrichaceae archaeon]
MGEIIPLRPFRNVYLMTVDPSASVYPASRIQKGLVLGCGDRDLSEEGIGFGAPVFKFEEEAIFPGRRRARIEEHEDRTLVRADYVMNLTAKTARKGQLVKSRSFYRAKNAFSSLHRGHPSLRKGLTFSSAICRRVFQLEDDFAEVPPLGFVRATYRLKGCEIRVDLEFSKTDGCSEVVVMNEQGANYFDTYRDSDGLTLQGDDIGSWDETLAEEASFVNPADKIAFTLKRVKGARMFRGRELAAKRLAWSGLAYVLPAETERFAYTITIGTGRT